ncbi:hypothetical protein HRR83_003333 [Exophiala dermatitidis]|uniref:Autophagy-related protein 28 n=2 Tax=Exophiala dermatitidis TaxID=5970 RepID=H6BMS3_EXODN|nr:uncharacterized protein HMPREF1120_00320 [Exophiala dermatitidis NIH/UT8656]KAJ4514759.1 hypothetical protein HRR75_004123 [Exophiala dermatitidis]EHY52101.1 hypothetical protein HMPREF1120_00320 [Exophiala dermatitidis NIH/UT8656]KAJ4518214.1 hypothetical protein HRR74_004509 [Exophiala dermatitidis]KAJ4521112.1 hypothetical protein HRR73_003453 [Exophiala dermatitidis]KAJ4547696.1 hypothetical protein HRR76_000327 [Exophiala dermatitidis]
MKKSFIERIFPHSPGDTLPQYEHETTPPSQPPSSPPRILLQESTASSPAPSTVSSRRSGQPLTSSLLRYDDPFLPVERAARALEQTLQALLDAQSDGLLAGVGTTETNDISSDGPTDKNDVSSAGSPTPTPSIATSSLRRHDRTRTLPIRQPKSRKISLQGARRGLTKSIVEFAHLKEWELSLIDQEVAARQVALRQASDLSNQRKLLEEGIEKINNSDGAAAAGLRSEAQKVEEEIYQLEARLAELKARHRQLVNRAQEIENSRDSELSSYTESLRLNDEKVRSFLRQPPVGRSLSIAREPGMYALKPDRRTLRMAEDQWTSEVETLNLRKSSVEKEKRALEEGSRLWKSVVHRVVAFEKALRAQMKDLSQSQLGSFGGGDDSTTSNGTSAEDASLQVVLSELSALIAFLEEAVAEAETHDWKLLICSIGAELAAFQQARDALLQTMGLEDSNFEESATKDVLVEQHDDGAQGDLLSDGLVDTNRMVSHSPAESSNQSLEDTMREFGGATGPDRNLKNEADSGLGVESTCPKSEAADDNDLVVQSRTAGDQRSESEDDDPGPEFLVSHT